MCDDHHTGYVSSLSEVEQNQSTRERVGAMCDDSVAEALRKFYADEQVGA
jgi:hypothetical protein